MTRFLRALLLLAGMACSPGYWNPGGGSPAAGTGGSSGASADEGSGGGGGVGTVDAAAPAPDAAVNDDASSQTAPCTGGQAQVVDPANGHCYVFFQDVRTWATAVVGCNALGASWHLASLTSQAEQALVSPIVGTTETWIGFSNQGQTDPTLFTWVTGEATAYTDWATGEPNDGANTCARIKPSVGSQWADQPCTSSYAFLCERE
jgi:hypothetical protein